MVSTHAPGNWVRLAGRHEWGPGQVQSVTGHRVTVNFEQAGKRVVHVDSVELETIEPERTAP